MVNHRRNVEDIRRKNLEDNQLFLKQLLMPEIRDDFLHSARFVLRKNENTKKPIEHAKIEYSTRYSLKVKSGEIAPHIPECQRKKLEKEEQQRQKEMKRQAMEIQRQEKQRAKEMEREEKLFEEELKKIERILKFEEAIEIKRAERHRHCGLSKWELLYQDKSNPQRRSYNLRHTKMNE